MLDTRGHTHRPVSRGQLLGLVLCDIAIVAVLAIVPLATWLLLT